ncbi:immunoglobulin superfamily member 11 isoform X2 [Sarcophilus harrisii]|uniref:immunoglobulin superfamily member 11 isoform X2 n=1 Tax=Sarcophilus harrisii TaxID=9305 RepID=UPI001301D5FD|nr:immunoglobulin superfamily member 11 isoform X2 [Sarcophilus harrisii]
MTSRSSPLAPLLLLSLQGIASSLDVSESPGSIQVARGQTAVLPCTFTTSAALINLNVIWMVIPLSNANQPEQVILYQGGQMFDGAPRFHGRVGFTGTMPATNVSIFINNTQLMDTGTYQCLVNNLPDRGGRNIGVTGLTVLVPPSVPLCRIQGSQDIGSDVILICSSEEGIPRPTYLWEKLDNIPRLPPSATQDQIQGTVTLRNISSVSSGLYQCVASNAIGTSTCLLDLQVISPQPRSIGVIAGVVSSAAVVVILCLILMLVAFFYWRNRNKEEEEEEIPNEIRSTWIVPLAIAREKVNGFLTDTTYQVNPGMGMANTFLSSILIQGKMIFPRNVLHLPKLSPRRSHLQRTTRSPRLTLTIVATGPTTLKFIVPQRRMATWGTCTSPSLSIQAVPMCQLSMPTGATWSRLP